MGKVQVFSVSIDKELKRKFVEKIYKKDYYRGKIRDLIEGYIKEYLNQKGD